MFIEEYEFPSVPLCQSVGYLIKETKREIAIAQTLAGPYIENESIQALGVTRIPTSAIRRRIRL